MPAPEPIEATTLIDEFDANQVAASQKWKGKLIQTNAKISDINESGLILRGLTQTNRLSLTAIFCRVKDRQQLIPLTRDENVAIQGVIDGLFLTIVQVNSCEILG